MSVSVFVTTRKGVQLNSREAIVAHFQDGKVDVQEFANLIVAFEKAKPLTVSITEKGGVKVAGLKNQKYPATYYPSDWLLILGAADEIRQVIKDNEEELEKRGTASKAARKAEKEKEKAEAKAAKANKTETPKTETTTTPDEAAVLAAFEAAVTTA